MTPALQARAASLQAEFEALPPPALRREIVDLALDLLAGPESRAKAGAPEIFRILTRRPVIVCGAGEVMRSVAWLLVAVSFVAAITAFWIAATRLGASPWPLLVVSVCLAVSGIVFLARQSPQQ